MPYPAGLSSQTRSGSPRALPMSSSTCKFQSFSPVWLAVPGLVLALSVGPGSSLPLSAESPLAPVSEVIFRDGDVASGLIVARIVRVEADAVMRVAGDLTIRASRSVPIDGTLRVHDVQLSDARRDAFDVDVAAEDLLTVRGFILGGRGKSYAGVDGADYPGAWGGDGSDIRLSAPDLLIGGQVLAGDGQPGVQGAPNGGGGGQGGTARDVTGVAGQDGSDGGICCNPPAVGGKGGNGSQGGDVRGGRGGTGGAGGAAWNGPNGWEGTGGKAGDGASARGGIGGKGGDGGNGVPQGAKGAGWPRRRRHGRRPRQPRNPGRTQRRRRRFRRRCRWNRRHPRRWPPRLIGRADFAPNEPGRGAS